MSPPEARAFSPRRKNHSSRPIQTTPFRRSKMISRRFSTSSPSRIFIASPGRIRRGETSGTASVSENFSVAGTPNSTATFRVPVAVVTSAVRFSSAAPIQKSAGTLEPTAPLSISAETAEPPGFCGGSVTCTQSVPAVRRTGNFSLPANAAEPGSTHSMRRPPKEMRQGASVVAFMPRMPTTSFSSGRARRSPERSASGISTSVKRLPPSRNSPIRARAISGLAKVYTSSLFSGTTRVFIAGKVAFAHAASSEVCEAPVSSSSFAGTPSTVVSTRRSVSPSSGIAPAENAALPFPRAGGSAAKTCAGTNAAQRRKNVHEKIFMRRA